MPDLGYTCGAPSGEPCKGDCSSCYGIPSDVPASKSQVGGAHYKDMAIQPAEYCQKNGLSWCEANIVKYASRHAAKNGAEDVRKIIHYARLLLEFDYEETE